MIFSKFKSISHFIKLLEIFLKLFHSNCLLLAYRNKIDFLCVDFVFYNFVKYPDPRSLCFVFVDFPKFSTQTIMLSVTKNNCFFLPHLYLPHLFFLPCLIALVKIFNRSGKNGHPCFVLSIRGKSIQVFTTNYDDCCGFLYIAFHQGDGIPPPHLQFLVC